MLTVRSAAQRQPEDDPGPGRAELDARAAGVLGAHLDLAGRIDATLAAWGSACPHDSEAGPALQAMGKLVIDASHHAEELRRSLASYTATAGALEAAFAAGRACERASQESPPATGPKHAAGSAGKRLRLVKGGTVAAFAGLWPALHRAWAIHRAATAAAAATAGIALTATTAAVVHPSSLPFTSSPPSASAAAGPVTAVRAPVNPSQKLIASVTRPQGSRTLTVSLPPSVAAYAPAEAPPAGDGNVPAPPPASQGPQVSLVVTREVDMGTLSSGPIRVTAFGGPVSWSASASAPGMTLDVSSGSLAAGHSAVITVTLAADLQALAGPGSVTISYDGQDVAIPVSWSVIPLPVPSPSDTGLPTDLPTLPPVLGS